MTKPKDEEIAIPPAFWQSMAIEDFREVILRGGLNAEQCAMLWRMTDRQGPAPEYLQVFANRYDLMREYPAPKSPLTQREKP